MGTQCNPAEDHEKYAGEVIPDPWEDPDQTDWPMNPEGGVVDALVRSSSIDRVSDSTQPDCA